MFQYAFKDFNYGGKIMKMKRKEMKMKMKRKESMEVVHCVHGGIVSIS